MESAFGLSHSVLTKAGASTEQVIQWFTKGPSAIMGWNIVPFQVGNLAEVVIIDPRKKWKFNESDIQSRSKNSPMLGMQFTGKVDAVISGKFSFGSQFD